MHDLLPDGEELRRAVRWVSIKLEEEPGLRYQKLVQDAIFKFDLSPKESEMLFDFFRQREAEAGS